jgi:hypothetical protein
MLAVEGELGYIEDIVLGPEKLQRHPPALLRDYRADRLLTRRSPAVRDT